MALLKPRAIARELLLITLFATLAVLYTWPLARDLGSLVSDPGDPFHITWILSWTSHALTHDPLHLFDAPLLAGARYSLAFSEHLTGIALLLLPFRWAGSFTPIELHNIAILIAFTLNAYGATVLARTAGASLGSSIVAGISFGFGQYFFDHLPHLQVVSSGWLPLTLAALIRLLRKGGTTSILLFTAAFVMNGLTNTYALLFAGAATAATVALFCWDREQNRTRIVRDAAVATLLCAVALIPFLLPYYFVSRTYKIERQWSGMESGSAHLDDFFRGTDRNILFRAAQTRSANELDLAPGLLPMLLAGAALLLTPRREPDAAAIKVDRPPPSPRLLKALDISAVVLAILAYIGGISTYGVKLSFGDDVFTPLHSGSTPLALFLGVVTWRWSLRLPDVLGGRDRTVPLRDGICRSRFWPIPWIGLLWVLVGVMGALGNHSFLHGLLFHNVLPFRATRVPARWVVIFYTGLVILAARGADLLLARVRGGKRVALMAALLVVALAETAVRIDWYRVNTDPVPVYEWLKSERVTGPIFELPMDRGYEYDLALASHQVPLINGVSSFWPPWLEELAQLNLRNEFNDVFLSSIAAHGTQLIIVHADTLGPQGTAILDWLRRAEESGQVVFLRRFDRGERGDYVFALRDAAGWQRLRSHETLDAAGYTEQAAWRRLVAGETVYSSQPVLHFAEPQSDAEIHRVLRVSGWAVAPAGVKSVTVSIADGRIVLPAARHARDDIRAAYPWYLHDPLPGFEVVLPKRPKGIQKNVALQITVTDNAGRTVHSDTRRITWH